MSGFDFENVKLSPSRHMIADALAKAVPDGATLGDLLRVWQMFGWTIELALALNGEASTVEQWKASTIAVNEKMNPFPTSTTPVV